MRLIDADGLLDRNAEFANREFIHPKYQVTLRELVDSEPTLSPDDVRGVGEWIGDGDGYADGLMVYDMWSCSCCGEYFDEWDDRPTWKYCPNCGAKMEVSDDA